VSLWLNAVVPAPQVAEWAGHSVHVLMKVYAKCIYGQEEAAKRRIEAALKLDETGTNPATTRMNLDWKLCRPFAATSEPKRA
jgi:hypothetical protein